MTAIDTAMIAGSGISAVWIHRPPNARLSVCRSCPISSTSRRARARRRRQARRGGAHGRSARAARDGAPSRSEVPRLPSLEEVDGGDIFCASRSDGGSSSSSTPSGRKIQAPRLARRTPKVPRREIPFRSASPSRSRTARAPVSRRPVAWGRCTWPPCARGPDPGLWAARARLDVARFTREAFRRARREAPRIRRAPLPHGQVGESRPIGNAYADEILFAARLHPKTFCHKLTAARDEIDALFAGDPGASSKARSPRFGVATRRSRSRCATFLAVRGRDGSRAPRAGRRSAGRARSATATRASARAASRRAASLFVDFSRLPPRG